ncbi:FmdB family zinc ribbon protein [Chloroflexota bacterium]
MPLYEYICSNCGYEFELLRPLSKAGEEATCPKCHNPSERKLSTFAHFTMSGSETITPGADSNPERLAKTYQDFVDRGYQVG